jgi:CCR4-NOT complex subunit CAF16
MHQISDGERRRVQLCMGLMGEWDVLLLDEVSLFLERWVSCSMLITRSRSTSMSSSDLI